MSDQMTERIRLDVASLCGPGDRAPGTERNRWATDHVTTRMRAAGLEVDEIEFEVPRWRCGSARITAAGLELDLHPGPYSPSLEGDGPLAWVMRADELQAIEPGSVLLLSGEIAAEQFTPRGYPFYENPEHAAILDAIEAAQPIAVLAATGKSAMTGGMSPFPLIEEVGFPIPSAYLTVQEGIELATHAGEVVSVRIQSEVMPSTGTQPVGRTGDTGAGRVVVSAHVDSKDGSPGAIDNAAGVAVMLSVADMLSGEDVKCAVEFVPFNGEDHVLAPGEMAWLERTADLSDIRLNVNLDAPGLPGAPSAYSLYGADDELTATVARLASEHSGIAEGPQWPASDHMIFAMRGVPAMAVTSTDFATASGEYSHTPADTPDILDYDLLAATARFVADVVRAVEGV